MDWLQRDFLLLLDLQESVGLQLLEQVFSLGMELDVELLAQSSEILLHFGERDTFPLSFKLVEGKEEELGLKGKGLEYVFGVELLRKTVVQEELLLSLFQRTLQFSQPVDFLPDHLQKHSEERPDVALVLLKGLIDQEVRESLGNEVITGKSFLPEHLGDHQGENASHLGLGIGLKNQLFEPQVDFGIARPGLHEQVEAVRNANLHEASETYAQKVNQDQELHSVFVVNSLQLIDNEDNLVVFQSVLEKNQMGRLLGSSLLVQVGLEGDLSANVSQ